jgi:two-component system OmpR family response regulator
MQHILVVDDDAMYTTMLRIILEAEGYTVTTIESGQRALEVLEQNEYDLILLDVMMPDLDGLFLSVRSDVADKVLGLRAGADDYLAKPFDPDELLARIRALLRPSGHQAETKTHSSS